MKRAVLFFAGALAATIAVLPATGAGRGSAGAADDPVGMAARLIARYHMQRVPQEGVWFALSYTGEDTLSGDALPERYDRHAHATGNAIFVVATRRDFSALHRLQTDEVWHWYGGSPLDLLLLYPDGHGQQIVLGNDVLHGQTPQFTVPHGVWQGAAPHGTAAAGYAFAGTQLSPAFDPRDFAIGYRDILQARYPAFRTAIAALTRAEFATAPAPAAAAVPAGAVVAATTVNAAAPAEAGTADVAAAGGKVFNTRDVPVVTAAPGVKLQELVGRLAGHAATATISVAAFSLAPGAGSGKSFNRLGVEILLVTQGHGQVLLGRKAVAVERDAVVYLPPGTVHEMVADADAALGFYALSVPAFSLEDYVPLAK